MVALKGICQGQPQRGSHGHPILLSVLHSIEIKYTTFGGQCQQSLEVRFRNIVYFTFVTIQIIGYNVNCFS